jgi:hypothetical protein
MVYSIAINNLININSIFSESVKMQVEHLSYDNFQILNKKKKKKIDMYHIHFVRHFRISRLKIIHLVHFKLEMYDKNS